VDFSQVYKTANPLALDLMQRMLKFNPADRIDVDAALAHPYLASLHDPAAEPRAQKTIVLGFEEDDLDGDHVRARMYDEMMTYYAK
jgi:serine/threonine protein kinase